MVETALFPRPHFSSYFHSDDRTDSLSYYEYQRLQRLQKVARLQERRAKSYEPGYKKPLDPIQAPHAHVTSRQIFVKPKPKESQTVAMPPLKKVSIAANAPSPPAAGEKREEGLSVPPIIQKKDEGVKKESVPKARVQSGRLSRAVERERLVKSATTRDPLSSSVKPHPQLLPRPKTVVGTRDVGTITSSLVFHPSKKGREAEKQKDAQKPQVESTKVVEFDGEDEKAPPTQPVEQSPVEKENMVADYQWTTSTQRAYNEVGWSERVPPPILPPPTTVEMFPDPVAQRLTFRRYNSCPEAWQTYGPEWDYVQTRAGDYQPRDPVNFTAPSRYNQYLPGYTGCVPGHGEVDHPFLSRLLVRRLAPRHTNISRNANIPGYTGHTHWTRVHPAHSDLPHPIPLTSARTHSEIPLEGEPSPFCRNGVLSKTITLVSPYNPFNKIEY